MPGKGQASSRQSTKAVFRISIRLDRLSPVPLVENPLIIHLETLENTIFDVEGLKCRLLTSLPNKVKYKMQYLETLENTIFDVEGLKCRLLIYLPNRVKYKMRATEH